VSVCLSVCLQFYGIERDLVLMDLLVFVMWDLVFQVCARVGARARAKGEGVRGVWGGRERDARTEKGRREGGRHGWGCGGGGWRGGGGGFALTACANPRYAARACVLRRQLPRSAALSGVQDVYISALLTYIVSYALVAIRDKFGTANVAAKTLIPDVFLV